MAQIDVHGMSLSEAKEYILKQIIVAYKKRNLVLEVIHGFNNGTSIKNWLQSSHEIAKNPLVQSIKPSLANSGSTLINIKLLPF